MKTSVARSKLSADSCQLKVIGRLDVRAYCWEAIRRTLKAERYNTGTSKLIDIIRTAYR